MKKLFLVFLFSISTMFLVFAQSEAPKYARSSVTMIQLQYDGNLDKMTSPIEKVVISKLYQDYVSHHFPEKYDSHQITTQKLLMSEVNAKPFEIDTTKLKGLEKQCYRYAMEAKDKQHIAGLDTIYTLDAYKNWMIYKNPNPDPLTQIQRNSLPKGKDGLPLLPPGIHEIFPDKDDRYHQVVDSLYYQGEYKKYMSLGSIGVQKFEQQMKAVLKEHDIARQIVARWFNYDGKPKADGSYFDMQVVAQRGYHNAGELDKMNAEGGARSARAILEESGELLIGNSFLMLNALAIYPNEPVERGVYETVVNNFGKNSPLTLAARLVYDAKKGGYCTKIYTSLWKLKWNESILNEFYEKCWNNPEYFETTDMFELEFVGLNDYYVNVAFSSNKSEGLSLCLQRGLDKVFHKIQKEYEIFRPIVTLMQESPYMAIDAGIKDGVSRKGGEKFEQVKLEQKETGEYFYKKTGVMLSTDKGYIYSNNLNPDATYSYSEENAIADSVYNAKTKRLEPKVWHWIDYQQPVEGEVVGGFLFVDELDPADKKNAKEVALVQKTLSALSIKCDTPKILKCEDIFDKSITYYVQSDGRWIVVPQIAPDGKVLKGTVVKGAKLPAGTLLRQSSFNKE